jgi:predicted histidine transporter YuiF (NhaC family)
MDNAKKNEKQLREFGLISATSFAILGGLLPFLYGYSLPIFPWIISAIILLLALFIPTVLQPVFQVLMKVSFFVGWITTYLTLGIVFYMMFVPVGLVRKHLFRQDPLSRSLDAKQNTYRLVSKVRTKESLEKPF